MVPGFCARAAHIKLVMDDIQPSQFSIVTGSVPVFNRAEAK